MKVVIAGYGAVGSVLAKLLVKDKSIESIHCLDLKFSERPDSKKIIFKVFNILEKDKLINYLKELKPDVAVNVLHPKFNANILECCAEAGVNYLDTASFWDIDLRPNAKVPYKMEQLDFNEKFTANNILGLIEAGVAPGLDNLMAAECASHLDYVEEIKIRMVEDTGSKKLFFSWSKEWLLDELATKPIIYENGKFKFVENFGGEEDYNFPAPIGRRKTYYFAQDEVGSIPFYIKTRKTDVKIYDNNIKVFKLLSSLGVTSNKPIKVGEAEVKPVDVLARLLPDPEPGEEMNFPEAVFAMAVEAIGMKRGKKKSVKFSVVFPNQKTIQRLNLDANFISYPTALSAALFALAIPKINKTGVFPPEAIPKEIRHSILRQLPKFHIKTHKNF